MWLFVCGLCLLVCLCVCSFASLPVCVFVRSSDGSIFCCVVSICPFTCSFVCVCVEFAQLLLVRCMFACVFVRFVVFVACVLVGSFVCFRLCVRCMFVCLCVCVWLFACVFVCLFELTKLLQCFTMWASSASMHKRALALFVMWRLGWAPPRTLTITRLR